MTTINQFIDEIDDVASLSTRAENILRRFSSIEHVIRLGTNDGCGYRHYRALLKEPRCGPKTIRELTEAIDCWLLKKTNSYKNASPWFEFAL